MIAKPGQHRRGRPLWRIGQVRMPRPVADARNRAGPASVPRRATAQLAELPGWVSCLAKRESAGQPQEIPRPRSPLSQGPSVLAMAPRYRSDGEYERDQSSQRHGRTGNGGSTACSAVRTLALLTRFRGATWGAIIGRHRAIPGHAQPLRERKTARQAACSVFRRSPGRTF